MYNLLFWIGKFNAGKYLVLSFSSTLTLNECGLFGSTAIWAVKEAGWDQCVLFLDNGLWWPQFSFKLHKQYLIWKLTFSAKFWNLSEVIEAYSLASGGYRSDRGQNEKKYAKIVKSPIFDSQKCNIPQKKPHENRHSDLKWNYRVLEWKSWKKFDFVIFDPKKS